MNEYRFVFLVLAIICFTLKALGVKTGQIDLVAAGFACVTAYFLP